MRRTIVSSLVSVIALGAVAPAFAQQPAAPAAAPPTAAPSAPPAAPPAAAAPAAPAGSEDAAQPDPAKKAEAEGHFKQGLKLLAEDAWQAALAEFLRSRELFPTRNATNNAAYCLRKLGRFDEALDMFETVLREFPNADAEKKAAAQKEVAELRALVGTIDVVGGEPGASIVVDGKPRAEFPLIDPLRVAAGTHTVRLFKEGFQAFETRVDVAGGQTARVEAKMPALAASGRLKVTEKSGKAMDVVVDGAVVGVTPWEGSLAVGEHVVVLVGDGDLGTVPTAAPVRVNDVTAIVLAAESLESSLAVVVEPAAASVRIDGVLVGRGVWDGRLRAGAHEITVEAEGFFPQKKSFSLARGDREELTVKLERDEDADKWRAPSHVTVDITAGLAIAPTLGGDVAGSCTDACSGGVGLGGFAMVHGAYEFGSGLGFGLGVGFLQASQSFEERPEALQPVGLDPAEGTANDDLRLRGVLVGIAGSYRFGETMPLRVRLGAGALIGSARDVRSGTYQASDGTAFEAPEVASEASMAMVYVDPEVSLGFRVADRIEIGGTLQGLVLIPASQPTWGEDETTPALNAGNDGLATYAADQKLVGATVLIVPGLHARAVF